MHKNPSFGLSLVPIVFLVALLCLNVIVFKDDASYGPNQIVLFCTAMLTATLGVFVLKHSYKKIEAKAIHSIETALHALLILLVVGPLISLWILSGVVPTMIYYGVDLINPTFFLPISVIICSLVSMVTGSSWSTAGTVGVALMGIGHALNIPAGMSAGAIVSGSYFGDKLSPLSDTTNLAPAMVGVDLFEHIQHMLYTTLPAIVITLFIFFGFGLFYEVEAKDMIQIESLKAVLKEHYDLNPWLFTLPLTMFALAKKRMPALPVLFVGVCLGVIAGLVFQKELLSSLTGGNVFSYKLYEVLMKTAFSGFESTTGHQVVDKLLSRGGMSSMLNTVWLILMAMIFGGMMEVTGMLNTLVEAILRRVHGVTGLVSSTLGTSLLLNLTASDQYISIVMTGRMFKKVFLKYRLDPKNLSRTVEDGATVTSVLIPWNTCGAYFSSVLGVATLSYLPFAFFNLLCPVVSVLLAATGKTMQPLEEKKYGHYKA